MYQALSSSSPLEPGYKAKGKVDERVAQAVVNVDDPDIVLDLRKANGHPIVPTSLIASGKSFKLTYR